MLTEKKVLLEYIAQRLLEKEIMEQKEFEEIVNAEANLSIPTSEKQEG